MLVANTAKGIAVSRSRQGKASFAASYNLNSFQFAEHPSFIYLKLRVRRLEK